MSNEKRPAPSPESQRVFAPGLLAGRVAVITGGGSGIGLATATEMARLGAKLAICGRSGDKLEHARPALEELTGSGGVFAQPCDIREAEHIERFVAGVMERYGRIDILVNNAGGQFPAPAQMISPKGFAAVVRNNLLGTFNMTRQVAVDAMIPATSGKIVNVIANIYRGFPGMVHTGAARAGVENMTMTLAVEWAQFNIQVNAVAPGVILSSGTKQYPEAILSRSIAAIPAGRAGTVDEVAASIVFLTSPASDYITGATLRIDGAQSLHGDTWMV